jgi:hypothetical protein
LDNYSPSGILVEILAEAASRFKAAFETGRRADRAQFKPKFRRFF